MRSSQCCVGEDMQRRFGILSDIAGLRRHHQMHQVSNGSNATPQRTPKMFQTQASKLQVIELFIEDTFIINSSGVRSLEIKPLLHLVEPHRDIALLYLVMVAFAQPAAPAPRVSFLNGFNNTLCQHTTLQTQ
jgi:hypothetical protein